MFTRNMERMALPATFVLAVGMIMPLPAQEPTEQETTSPETFASYSGGVVRAKRAKTQTTATFFPSTLWTTLPSSTLSYTVSAGFTELFNVAFSAECTKTGGGVLYIRILDNGVALQPYDGFQVFCSSASTATYKGNWVRRTPVSTVAITHNLVVQFRVSSGSATIDDWTFETVVYD
jgi:hypothetical protein